MDIFKDIQTTFRSSSLNNLAIAAAGAVIAFGASRLSLVFIIQPEGMAPFWLANALVLLALLRLKMEVWPKALIGAFLGFTLAAVTTDFDILRSSAYALVNMSEVFVLGTLIRRVTHGAPFHSLRNLVIFILATAGASAVGATLARYVYPINWLLWFIDDALGFLILVPLFLADGPISLRAAIPTRTFGRVVEAACLIGGLMFTTFAIYKRFDALPYLKYSQQLVPFMLWAAMRFKTRGVAACCLIIAVMSATFTLQGHGPFAQEFALVRDRVLGLQIFLILLIVPHLVIAVVLEERSRVYGANRRLQTLADEASDFVGLVGMDGRFLYLNRAGRAMIGLSPSSPAKDLLLAEVCPDVPSLSEQPEELYPSIQRRDTVLKSRDGRTTPISQVVISHRNAYNSRPFISIVARDITAEKFLETQRTNIIAQERRAKEAAERHLRLTEEFLMVVSHELRTPLASILGWADILRTTVQDDVTAWTAADTIMRNAREELRLVDDLLGAADVTRQELRLNLEPRSLTAIVRHSISAIRPLATAKRLTLTSQIPDDPMAASCDEARLHQVFRALLSNAIKFTPEGGKIQVQLERQGDTAQIVISDSGIGISGSDLDSIFKRFVQGDMSTTRRFGGMGLGLAVARELTEAHGGSVVASSLGAGQGATFKVTLPLLPASASLVADPEGRSATRYPSPNQHMPSSTLLS